MLAKSCRFYVLRLYVVKSMVSENEDLLIDPGVAWTFSPVLARSSCAPEYSEPEGKVYRLDNDWCA